VADVMSPEAIAEGEPARSVDLLVVVELMLAR
jgi:hypothetical protein